MKRLTLIAGDIVCLYLSLVATIGIRYGESFSHRFGEHMWPMTMLFGVWLLMFYVAGLYDLRRLRNNIEFIKTLWLTLAINAVLAVLFFYLVPWIGITPRRNLFLFLVIFTLIETLWRRAWNRTAALGTATEVAIIEGSSAAKELIAFLDLNPQLGYRVRPWSGENTTHKARIVVIPYHIKENGELKDMFYNLLVTGTRVVDLIQFYESTVRKVPTEEIDTSWILQNIGDQHRFYDNLKRAAEFLFALVLQILLVPLELVIALLVKLSSPGPVIYRQVRVGRHGMLFTLYKFRTMRADAEKDGPRWATPNDARTTPIGKILRMSHLDELPQLVNILKGNLSFVGPRPERPEFVKDLRTQVPFYEVRQLIKPGVTGWAQLNCPSDKTIKDVQSKLQYDLYYLKNRSFILDLAIVIRTLKLIFKNPQ